MNDQEQEPKVIQVYNKKAKTTYLYEDIAYWDPELKQGRHKRKGIGKLDDNGNPVYNDYYLNRLEQKDRVASSTTLLGENLILDRMIADTGLSTVLSKTIGKERADLALQLVRYSVCEDNALSYAGNWLEARGFDGSALCFKGITDLLRSLDRDVQNAFYARWIAKKAEKKNLLFDISSIASYAKDNPYEERGYNRDHEGFEQIHIALISTYQSNTPLWCVKLPGSMSDQVALEYVCGHLQQLDVGKVGILLDRGSYSEDSIRDLIHKGHKFTMLVPSHIKWQEDFINNHRGVLQRPANLIATDDKDSIIYGLTVVNTTEHGRMWVHLYYDAVRKERDIAHLMEILKKCQEDLEEDRKFKSREPYYQRYFEVEETPVQERKVHLKSDEVDAYIYGHSGYCVLLSTHEEDTANALFHYRQRNNIELDFSDMKNLMDCNLLGVHSDDVMQGRVFINFLAMIVVNELNRSIASIPAKEGKYWNYKIVLHKVANYSRIHYTGKYTDTFSVPTESQRLIFNQFGIRYN